MIQAIRVKTIIGPDLLGDALMHEITHMLRQNSVKAIQTARVYRLEGISEKQAKRLADTLFAEAINQTYTLNKPLISKNANVVEIAYKPGVMNPEVASILKVAKDLGIPLVAADASREYGFFADLSKEKIKELVEKLNVYNKTVEYIVDREPSTLVLKGRVGKTTTIPIRNLNDEELMALSKDKLFLNVEEMKVIQKYFKKIRRDPTDCEVETLAQTWSEHSGHKTFKARLSVDDKEKEPLITRIKKEALKHNKHIVSAFVDNSGVMDFYDGWAICGKVETHNSPSAIEPYGGAMTGSGGVFRDILGTGKGAKSIVSTDMFCFAKLDSKEHDLPPGTLPPRYLLKRVVSGVRDYGNRMGIPTNNGSLHFHNEFRAKPTVIVGAYGLLPKKYAKIGKPKKGDLVLSVGGRVGKDGIHGATFSSAEMTDRTISVNASAVQIGNAIEQKRMFDAILEARDFDLLRAIQDCGGGGYSSAIGEIGKETGVTIHLENAPLKYQGLAPWEIWLSESQERMVVVLPRKNLKKFLAICKKYNVSATELGVFDGSKKLRVYFGKELVCNLDMKFLHNGLPQRKMLALNPNRHSGKRSASRISMGSWTSQDDIPLPHSEKGWINMLKKVFSHGNVCSKEPILRLYDHSVQGTNALQPFSGEMLDGPNDAVVMRPILNKPYGMIIAHGLNPVLNTVDPYWGSIWASVEALSNYVAVGGDWRVASLINNYIWPFPDEESLWSLDRCVDAVVDTMKAFKMPVISGKDSLSSTYRKEGLVIKIPPVLCMSVFGRIKDVAKTTSSDFKKQHSLIVLVGKPDYHAMGGSIYYDVHGMLGDRVPQIDLSLQTKVFAAIHKAILKNNVLSVHDISEGGMITAIFEMCVGGNRGADIDLSVIARSEATKQSLRPDYVLFNETAGCFIVEVENERIAKQVFKNVPFAILGKTTSEKTIVVANGKQTLFNADLKPLKKSWQAPMQQLFA